MGQYFLFCSYQVIALAYFFGKMAPVINHNGGRGGYLWFSAMHHALLHSSRHSPADKIEERNTFALIHARLYLAESDYEQDDKSMEFPKKLEEH